ncbi:MAG: FAD-binding oxidoreductase [Chloroflexi bacterium]|nr:FAD-binding oxidoreductase [Chloroflexota bacterium]
MSLTPTLNTLFDSLASQVRGRVIRPDDPDYDPARKVAAGHVDRRPAAIVRVAGADDIATVIAVARESSLPLAVLSGGHSGEGHGVVDDGIVIDLRDMKAMEIDVAGRTGWFETGLTAGEVTRALAEHGLAVGFGDTGSVGIGGITLGGGAGYLVRKHGLTIDSLLAAEIVTADGQLRLVDAEHEPDLFWAIRGGGGNFGVATRFRFRLVELPSFVGGMLVLPASAEVVQGFMAAAEAAPEELSAIVNVMPCPPLPFVAPEHHGTTVIFAFLGFAGETEAGQRALAPFRALTTPHADLTRPMAYPEMYPPEEGEGPGFAVTGRSLFIDHVDRAAAETIVAAMDRLDAPLRAVQLRVVDGAAARVPADATAYAHRSNRIMAIVVASYASLEERPSRQAWVEGVAGAIDQGLTGIYVNFLSGEGPERIRAAYPGATFDRLAAIKARYDPANLFRSNENIPPARPSRPSRDSVKRPCHGHKAPPPGLRRARR